jgi:hypothetical protein
VAVRDDQDELSAQRYTRFVILNVLDTIDVVHKNGCRTLASGQSFPLNTKKVSAWSRRAAAIF